MASYSVRALALDQTQSSARFVLAASVFEGNGLGVPNLSASNFVAHNLTSETRFSITEVQSIGTQGFYRLVLSAAPITHPGECILALVVTGRHAVGRVPDVPNSGNALVKVKVL